MPKISHVIKRSGAIVPFNPDRITNAIYRAAVSEGGRDQARAAWLASEVVKLLEQTIPEAMHPHIEQIQDAVEKILIENGHAQVAKAYILYREERARERRGKDRTKQRPSENVPWEKTWKILNWAVSENVHTIDALNERIRGGEFPLVVKASEEAYEREVDSAAELIIARADKIRMVIISGPSSSGKTTTTTKLEKRLGGEDLEFVPINVDNYFFNLEMHPKDEFGDFDFETPQALDLALINQHLQELISGNEVRVPFYDFKTGKRVKDHTPMRLAENQILLIDSLHGLFPSPMS